MTYLAANAFLCQILYLPKTVFVHQLHVVTLCPLPNQPSSITDMVPFCPYFVREYEPLVLEI